MPRNRHIFQLVSVLLISAVLHFMLKAGLWVNRATEWSYTVCLSRCGGGVGLSPLRTTEILITPQQEISYIVHYIALSVTQPSSIKVAFKHILYFTGAEIENEK